MLSCRPRSAHRSISKPGQQACSNTTSASRISPPPSHRAASARSYRARSPHLGEGPLILDSKNPQGEALLTSGKTTGRHHHVQPTLNVHRAASATTANRTASRVKVDKCLSPCDRRRTHRMARVRDLNQEGHHSMVDCHLRRGECTAMCNSPLFCVQLEDTFFCAFLSSAGHFWGYLRMYGMYNSSLLLLAERDVDGSMA